MSLKPLNSPGGFSVGEITSGAINVISSTGNVTTNNLISTSGTAGNINVSAGNLIVGDAGSGYIYANGAFLTGLGATYANSDVANYLPTYTGALPSLTGNVITTANVSGSYIIGNGSALYGILYSNIVGAYSNTNVSDYLSSGQNITISTTGNIGTTANISAAYVLGNGSFLTGMYSNASVKAYLESGTTINANFGGGNISTTGTANLGVTTVNGNLNVAGNIIATGNITYIGVQDLVISDPMIYLGANNTGDLLDIGIVGSYNDGTYAHTGVVRDHTDDTWKIFQGVTTEPNTVVDWSQAVYAPLKSGAFTSNASITANTFITAVGNVSGGNITTTGSITATGNITGGNIISSNAVLGNIDVGNIQVSGNVSVNSLYSNTFITAVGNLSGGNISTTGSITATGNISGNNISGTLTTASQPNITTVGVLSALTVAATVYADGYSARTGSDLTLSVLGANANIRIAPNGTGTTDFSGKPIGNISTVTASGNITGGNIITTGNVVTGGIKTDNYYYANGQPLDMQQPSGSNTQIQFNSDGNFGASANFTFDVATNTLTVTGTSTTTGNVSGGNINTTGQVVATGNVSGGNVTTAGQVAATGNVTGGNLNTTGQVVATGNITGGNINTAGQVVATGNITGGNINTAGQVVATGNVSGGNVTTAGNATANNVITSNYLQLDAASSTGVREQAYTLVTTSTSLQSVASIPVASLPASSQSIEVTIRGVNGNNTQASKMLITWNGAGSSDYSRYGEVILGTGCGVPSATFNGTNLLVQVTPLTTSSTTWTAKVTSV